MNKKIIILITFIFLLTGCEVNYNLNITEDNITEKIEGTYEINTCEHECDSPVGQILDMEITPLLNNADNLVNKYTENSEIEDNYGTITKEYKFTHKNYGDSYLLNTCFKNKNYENKDGYIFIKVSDFSGCYMSSDVNINITTDLKVLDNNADYITNNTYTWKIDENNYKEYEIIFKVKSYKIITYAKWPIIIICIFLISFILVLKSKKVNEIK